MRLDNLAQTYREQRTRDLNEFDRLQQEKNKELENLRRERDSVRREAEDLQNQIDALTKTYNEESRKYAQIEADLQAEIDALNARYNQRQEEIEKELSALRQKYEHLISIEQGRLDALAPEVEAILNRKGNDNQLQQDRLRLEQAQREREARRKEAKLREEQERLAKEAKRKPKSNFLDSDEHWVDSSVTLNYTDAQLEKECNRLFNSPPIEFRASPNSALEEDMSRIYNSQHLTIPIINIRDKLYLVGSNRMTFDVRSGAAVVKVGGGYERFDDYISKNQRQLQRRLVTYMINNQASLEWVVNQLIDGKNLQVTGGTPTSRPSYSAPTTKSPVRKSVTQKQK